MLALLISVAAIAAPATQPTTKPAPPVTAAQVRASLEKSIPFIEAKGVSWLDNSKCIACHHGAWMVWSLNEAKHAGIAVEPAKFDELSNRVAGIYQKDAVSHIKKKAGWVESTYMLMSQYDDGSAGQKSPAWRNDAISIIAATQRKDGSWKYAGQGLDRPDDENDEATTLWAMLALPKTEAVDPQVREKAMAYLKSAKSEPGLDSLALRLALEAQYGDASKAAVLRDELIARQNTDGGWKWDDKRATDAFATGEALYVLSLAGVKNDSPAIQKAWSFLVATQQPDGSWLCMTRKPKGENKVSTYWGTTFAVIGLSRTLQGSSAVSAAR